MKKIFAFMAIAVMALSFASCNKNEPSKVSFEITVSEITTTGATVAVVASDTTTTYYWDVFTAESAAELKTKEDVAAAFKEIFDYYIENFPSYFSSYADFLVAGEDGYAYSSLSSNTEYVVLCVALDENCAAVSEVTRKEFKTPELVITETVDLDFHAATLTDFRDMDGSFQIVAESEDGNLKVLLNPYSMTLAGSFTADDLDPNYSGVIDFVAQEVYDIVDAEFTGTETADGADYEGWFTATNGVKYNFLFNAVVDADEAPARNAVKKMITKKIASEKLARIAK